MQMEHARCKMVAIEIEDPRGAGQFTAVTIEAEDSRCRSLVESLVLEVEDSRHRRVAIKMEDPRCQCLHMKW
jgi:hypothetical protein